MRKRFITVAFAVFTLTMATFSHASTTLVGGGSTMTAYGFAGNGTGAQIFPAGSGSLFGVFSSIAGNPKVSYCQSGDGPAENIFALELGTSVQIVCAPNSSGTFQGFGANASGVGQPNLTQPHFIIADAPLDQSEVDHYAASHGGDLPIQFPIAAAAIAIAVNMDTSNGVVLNVSNTNFSNVQICKIFSGAVTNWADPALASAFTLQAGDSIPSAPIMVVYRSDDSGTTFDLFNYLTTVCTYMPPQHFITQRNFISGVSEYFPTLPTDWIGAQGNRALTETIASTRGSIGYAEMTNSLAAGVPFTRVDGMDPATFGSTKFIINGSNLVYNQVVIGNYPDGAPMLGPVSPLPSTQCILTVTPSSYADPSGSYPIMAISYLLGNPEGNGADLANARNLFGAPYNNKIINSPNLMNFGVGIGLSLVNAGTLIEPSTVAPCLIN